MKPTNVQIHRTNGETLNCELAHLGTDPDGMDCWEIANAVYQPGDELTIAIFPTQTRIRFATTKDALEVHWTADT